MEPIFGDLLSYLKKLLENKNKGEKNQGQVLKNFLHISLI